MNKFRAFVDKIVNIRKHDPVVKCKLFKELGCAHVDGYLCDFPDCDMHEKYQSTNKQNKENGING